MLPVHFHVFFVCFGLLHYISSGTERFDCEVDVKIAPKYFMGKEKEAKLYEGFIEVVVNREKGWGIAQYCYQWVSNANFTPILISAFVIYMIFSFVLVYKEAKFYFAVTCLKKKIKCEHNSLLNGTLFSTSRGERCNIIIVFFFLYLPNE